MPELGRKFECKVSRIQLGLLVFSLLGVELGSSGLPSSRGGVEWKHPQVLPSEAFSESGEAQVLNHGGVDTGSLSVNRFCFEPFVLVQESLSPIKLAIGIVGEQVDFLSIDLDQLGLFGEGIAFLEDDGIAPDVLEGDGVFTVELQPTPFASRLEGDLPATSRLRLVRFLAHLENGDEIEFVEDVATSLGLLERLHGIETTLLGSDVRLTERIVNLVRPERYLTLYPIYTLDAPAVCRDVFELLGDRFDWVVLCEVRNSRGLQAAEHIPVRNAVSGIGQELFDQSQLYGSHGVLRSVLHLRDLHVDGLDHQYFHTWGVYGIERLGLSSSVGGARHWGAIANDGEATIFGFPGSLAHFEVQANGDICGPVSVGKMLALELYLMGLWAPETLPRYEAIQGATFLGFDCGGYLFSGGELVEFSGEEWVEQFGARSPAYPDVNRFHAAVVVVSDRTLTVAELEFLERSFAQHETAFTLAYRGRATVSYSQRPNETKTLATPILRGDRVASSVSGPPGELRLRESIDLKEWHPVELSAPTGEAVLWGQVEQESWFLKFAPE